MENEPLVTVEFHCHTVRSRDSSNRIPELIEAARARGIDKLAITDHNTIAGALRACELAPEMIIVGEEILTKRGELLAYFLEEEIPARLPVAETIARCRAQDAFIAVPHPFDMHRHGWRMDELLDLLPLVDALEGFNTRSFRRVLNDRALFFAREHGMPVIAGSDAHSLLELGYARTLLPPFENADELRSAVQDARIQARRLSPIAHIRANLRVAKGRIFSANGENA